MVQLEYRIHMAPTDIVRGARLRTLPLSVAAVVTGAGCAVNWQGRVLLFNNVPDSVLVAWRSMVWVFLLCLGVAVFLQIAANYMNDYSDGIRGTDEHRDANAPARLVASGVPARQVLAAALVSVALACLCGLGVIALTQRWVLLAIGVLSIAAAWWYVGGRHPYGYMGWGEPAAFLFFGPVAVLGTQYAMCGAISQFGVVGAVAMGLNSMAVLSVNNLRDVQSDTSSGKRTWMVMFGTERGAVALCTMLAVYVLLLIIPWIDAVRSIEVIPYGMPLAIGACVGTVGTVAMAAIVTRQVVHGRFGRALMMCSGMSLVFAATYVCLSCIVL